MILGTAQLGVKYGISNKKGKPSLNQAVKILNLAHTEGVKTLDTAWSYGDAENVIGKLNQNRFDIISKLPDLSKIEYHSNQNIVSNFLFETLKTTKQQQLRAYLLHSVDNLNYSGNEIWLEMQELKEKGFTTKIGYSLYSPKQLDVYFKHYKPDIVQIPMNILDREFQKSGWLERLKEKGVEVHVRSVFLQGLLLMSHQDQLLKFPQHKKTFELFKNELTTLGVTAIDYCLGFIKGIKEIDDIVIGVNSAIELKDILASKTVFKLAPTELASSDENLIYPFNWS